MDIKLELDKESLDQVMKLKDEFRDGVLEGVRKSMYLVERSSKSSFNTIGGLHVRTGRLRSSIKSSVKRLKDSVHGIVGSNVIYAAVHEFGNFRTPARPFIRPAIDRNIDRINKIISDSINKEVQK